MFQQPKWLLERYWKVRRWVTQMLVKRIQKTTTSTANNYRQSRYISDRRNIQNVNWGRSGWPRILTDKGNVATKSQAFIGSPKKFEKRCCHTIDMCINNAHHILWHKKRNELVCSKFSLLLNHCSFYNNLSFRYIWLLNISIRLPFHRPVLSTELSSVYKNLKLII